MSHQLLHGHPFLRGVALLSSALCLLLFPAVGSAQSKGDAGLKEATKLVRSRTEDDLRRGAQLCAEIDNLASVELLLKVLADSQPHRRDVVWESLPDFTDEEARERVTTELKKNKRNAGARQWCFR